jgi:hypothetical protein
MADQELGLRLKTTSDVPQAMGKASQAVSNFDKQLADIGKKFSTSFKDIALGFVAPMVIVNKLISAIEGGIAKIMEDSKAALEFGSEASNKYVNEQESAVRRLIKLREEEREGRSKGERGTREAYADILLNNEEGRKIFEQNRRVGQGFRPYMEGDILKGHDKIAAEEMSKNPAIRAQLDAIVAKLLPGLEKDKDKTPTSFKNSDGISNVIGVGLSPGLVILNEQLRIQQEIAEHVKAMAAQRTEASDVDFTKYTGRTRSAPQYPKFK